MATERPHYYREDGHGVLPVYDLKADLLLGADRTVVKTPVLVCPLWWKFWETRWVNVSTVFLAIDHAFGDGPPVLYETMIFGGGDLFEDDQ